MFFSFIIRQIYTLMYSNPRTTEIVSSFSLIGWAIGALIGQYMGFYLSDRDSYSLVIDLMYQHWWVFFFSSVGFIQAVALFSNIVTYRQFAAFLSASLWFTLSILLLIEQIYNPAAWVYLTLAVSNCWAFAQIPRVYEKDN